jgi:PD-(D/E)XK nuclease superfamily
MDYLVDREIIEGMDERESDLLTGNIIGAAIDVHRILGPGLLESAFEACLVMS